MEILRVFKEAGWSGIVFPDSKSAIKAIAKDPRVDAIECPYKGKPREIFSAVCQWHRTTQDPECLKQKCGLAEWTEKRRTADVQVNLFQSEKGR